MNTPWILTNDRPARILRWEVIGGTIGFLSVWLPVAALNGWQLAYIFGGAIGAAITCGFGRAIGRVAALTVFP